MGKEEEGVGKEEEGEEEEREEEDKEEGFCPALVSHLIVLSSLLADHSNLENDAVCSNFGGALAPLCPLL